MATFPCPVCGETLLTPRFTDDGVMICPFCGEEIEAPEGWGRLDNEPAAMWSRGWSASRRCTRRASSRTTSSPT
jgi:uncharacterized Zn finger protein (UPF0148 family)